MASLKRFKINFNIAGQDTELFAEPMDMSHRMYSLERRLMDPHPLLIEHSPEGWTLCSQDNWGLSSEDINQLGVFLEKEFSKRPQE